MEENKNLIPIPGRLHSVTTDGYVTGTDEIIDDELNKLLSIINLETVGDDPNSLKSKVEAIEGIFIIDGKDSIITSNPEDIIAGGSKIPNANAVAGVTSFKTNERIKDVSIDSIINKDSSGIPKTSKIAEMYGEYTDNPEFIEVKLDDNNKILEAIRHDGTKYFGGDVENQSSVVSTVENPEFISVWTTEDNRILAGFQRDGNFYLGCGVPPQITSFVEKKVSEILGIEDTTEIIDSIKEFTSFLTGFDNTQNLLDYLNETYGEYIENPEFIDVKLDSEDKVLEATKTDGTKVFEGNVEVHGSQNIQGVSCTVISNPEWIAAWVDEEERMLMGIKRNGDLYAGNGNLSALIAEFKTLIDENGIQSVFSMQDNPEYLDVKTDSGDRILEAIRTNGKKYFPAGIDLGSAETETVNIPEYLEVKTDSGDRILEAIRKDGTKVIGGNLEIKGSLSVGKEFTFEGDVPQQIKDYVSLNYGGSGITGIEIDDDYNVYATYEDDSGVTDVIMDDEGNIYVEIEQY